MIKSIYLIVIFSTVLVLSPRYRVVSAENETGFGKQKTEILPRKGTLSESRDLCTPEIHARYVTKIPTMNFLPDIAPKKNLLERLFQQPAPGNRKHAINVVVPRKDIDFKILNVDVRKDVDYKILNVGLLKFLLRKELSR